MIAGKPRGFTLIELLIAVTVFGAVVAVAIPGFGAVRRSMLKDQGKAQLVADLRQARQTAVTRHRSVIVAFGDGSSTTNITSYTLHTDLDANRVRNTGEPALFRRLPDGVKLSKVALDPVDSLIFDTSGALWIGTSGGQLVLLGPRGTPDTLNVSAVGMVYEP